tara:strand:+ start:30041 stop:30523 length:483 start_codon:yes stop_codon:yes gene_type:complete
VYNQFKRKIKEILKNKYQNSIFLNKDFIIREKIKLEIKKEILKNKNYHNKCPDCIFFKNEFKNSFKLIKYFKKFNTHLNLKKKYDKNLKKLTNKNCSIDVLILLCENIKNIKNINQAQKLNTILKVNDILIVNYLEKKIKLHGKILQNFKLENKILTKFL